MLLVPDALLLPPDSPAKPWISSAYGEVLSAMLGQCDALRDRVAVLDVYGTQYLDELPAPGADAPGLDDVIGSFHANVGSTGLSFGMAYFPFLEATVVEKADITFAWFDNTPVDPATGAGPLQRLLTWGLEETRGLADPLRAQVQAGIDRIGTVTGPADVRALDASLSAALPLLAQMKLAVAARESLLPSAPALAGVMTYVDATRGVWNAPANVSLSAVRAPSFRVDSAQQEAINAPVDGKAVNALREFVGRGTVVWGGRTLDGNSNDYRYIQVRRTLIYIEQSIKAALRQFAFAPNTGQTWAAVTSMVSGFLTTVWSRGGLMGATPAEAFSVQCGLGSTMTGQDILDGYMIVQVTLQMVRPAEFIELTFKQKMEGVG
jgi:hypothetical protein